MFADLSFNQSTIWGYICFFFNLFPIINNVLTDIFGHKSLPTFLIILFGYFPKNKITVSKGMNI